MAVSYRANATECDWKQQTCCACGCVFRGALEPIDSGRRGRVRAYPCPTCGVLQPAVAARGKLLGHGLLTALSFVPLALFIGMGSGPTAEGALATDLCALIAAGVAGGFALLHLGVALLNPNGNLAANLGKAEKAIAAGKLETTQPGLIADPPKVPANLTALHCLALLSLLVAGPAFLSAVYLRSSNGWLNNAELRPELVGPGDEVRVEVPARHVQAVGSSWRGEVTARVLNAAEVGCTPTLKAHTGTESWGGWLRTKNDATETPIHPYALLVMPDDPALGGKTLRVRVNLFITYQARSAGKALTSEKTTVSRDFTIQLTGREDHQTYWLAWKLGAGVGFFCCLCGGLTLLCLALMSTRG